MPRSGLACQPGSAKGRAGQNVQNGAYCSVRIRGKHTARRNSDRGARFGVRLVGAHNHAFVRQRRAVVDRRSAAALPAQLLYNEEFALMF